MVTVTSRRFLVLAALGAVVFAEAFISEAQAQSRSSSYVPNTYQDFPFNQGSLFYQYRGPGTRRARTTPRRTAVPSNTVTQQVAPQQYVTQQVAPQQYVTRPAAPQQYYVPQQQYVPQQYVPQQYYVPQVQSGYIQQAPQYYYPAGYGVR